MVQLSESEMQVDHARWRDDYAGWLQEVELWQARHDEAIAELQRLFAFVKALRNAVRSHGDTIGAHEDVCRRHVDEIAGHGGAGPNDDAMALVHAQIAASHVHVRDAHEQISKNHRVAAARLRALVEVVDDQRAAQGRSGCGGSRHCAK